MKDVQAWAGDDIGSRLATLDNDGKPPETRLENANDAQAIVWRRKFADRSRSAKRAAVKGLIDGASPYKQSLLIKNGQANRCNVNWGGARSRLAMNRNSYYDIASEAPTLCQVQVWADNDENEANWGRIITEEVDRTLKGCKYATQGKKVGRSGGSYRIRTELVISQEEMCIFGAGPMMFMDETDWRPRAVLYKDVFVPEFSKSNVEYWEECVVSQSYLVEELYRYIRDAESASKRGWNVEAVKEAIIRAFPKPVNEPVYLQWERYEQMLKNGSFLTTEQPRTVQCAHIFLREFPVGNELVGKISHKIVPERIETDGGGAGGNNVEFFYENIGRYDDWNQVIHPFYLDHSGGGYHHSITGQGVQMFAGEEYINRLRGRICDQVFAPKKMFKPTTADDKEALSIAEQGDYLIMPQGLDYIQDTQPSLIGDEMAFLREIDGNLSANMAQYRENLQEPTGNPMTATETQWRASEQARLGKTQLDIYYDQLDDLYFEIVLRLCDLNYNELMQGGPEAVAFRERCMARMVPKEAFNNIKHVSATRVIGQGSPFQRSQALQTLIQTALPRYPEDGQQALIEDYTAAVVGQDKVQRYVRPQMQQQGLVSDQVVGAWDQVGGMKVGVPALVSASMDPVVYAQVFLNAGAQALASVQQGADPSSVLPFLHMVGPAIAQHLQRFANDPTRVQVYKALTQQFKQLAAQTDKLTAIAQKLQAHQQEQAQLQQKAVQAQAGMDPKTQIEWAQAQNEMHIKNVRTAQELHLREAAHNQRSKNEQAKVSQNLSLKDATTAATIAGKSQERWHSHAIDAAEALQAPPQNQAE